MESEREVSVHTGVLVHGRDISYQDRAMASDDAEKLQAMSLRMTQK